MKRRIEQLIANIRQSSRNLGPPLELWHEAEDAPDNEPESVIISLLVNLHKALRHYWQ